ncbi:segregation/condensation protein A [Bifidobacterium jacchi]|uniref:Segregation and condensation protein A n=1 Tax=Bifidobacterium jacchi TaxID=2490545 RepID=A0A5N5RDK2_9BIFI|nr:segregation/condensation protein A [Bifidobacterium jacchi]
MSAIDEDAAAVGAADGFGAAVVAGAAAAADIDADVADAAVADAAADAGAFHVALDVYSGPFDVLLSMIANRRLELTEVSLSAVTEEFLAYVRALDLSHGIDSSHGIDPARDIDRMSAFLDVASVLVEAKSAALLPGDEQGRRDEQSMEALRERDLLFARLVQYRAFRQAADDFRARLAANAGRFAHPSVVPDTVASMLPELVWTLTPDDLAALAAHAFANAPADEVSLHQLHVPLVDLRAQAALVRDRLRALAPGSSMTFAELTADARSSIEIVARFLAVLVFFRQGTLQFRQAGPYETLHLRWRGGGNATDDGYIGASGDGGDGDGNDGYGNDGYGDRGGRHDDIDVSEEDFA